MCNQIACASGTASQRDRAATDKIASYGLCSNHAARQLAGKAVRQVSPAINGEKLPGLQPCWRIVTVVCTQVEQRLQAFVMLPAAVERLVGC
jgi:hypothetical protein